VTFDPVERSVFDRGVADALDTSRSPGFRQPAASPGPAAVRSPRSADRSGTPRPHTTSVTPSGRVATAQHHSFEPAAVSRTDGSARKGHDQRHPVPRARARARRDQRDAFSATRCPRLIVLRLLRRRA
jgi:hypothetical protein